MESSGERNATANRRSAWQRLELPRTRVYRYPARDGQLPNNPIRSWLGYSTRTLRPLLEHRNQPILLTVDVPVTLTLTLYSRDGDDIPVTFDPE